MKKITHIALASLLAVSFSSCSLLKKTDPYAAQTYTQDPYGYAQQTYDPATAATGEQQQMYGQQAAQQTPTGEQAQVYPQSDGNYGATGTDNWQTTYEPTPEPSTSSGGSSYTVRRGDTMFGIARKHGTTPGKIASLNGISDPNRIRVGQRLRLP